MERIAALIQAVAALLWPLVALYAFHRFAPEIKSLAARLRKGKVLGQEIELERSLDRLGRTAAKAESEVAASVSTRSLVATPEPRGGDRSSESVQRILTTAAQSPKAGLLLLASELEGELRQLLTSFDPLDGRRTLPAKEAFARLTASGGMPRHVGESLRLFWDVRNKVVHGRTASDDEILRAIDSGLRLLRALSALPRDVDPV